MKDPGRLLTRSQAAAYLNISLSTFQRRVQPHIPFYPLGSLVRFDPKDLDAWLDTQKVGDSSGDVGSPGSGSGTKGVALSSPRVRAIRDRLERRQHASTPKLFLVKG